MYLCCLTVSKRFLRGVQHVVWGLEQKGSFHLAADDQDHDAKYDDDNLWGNLKKEEKKNKD